MIAISKIDDMYCVADTDTNQRGYFKSNGDQINGDNIPLAKEEIAYRIWRQRQNDMSEKKLRKEWEKVKTNFTT